MIKNRTNRWSGTAGVLVAATFVIALSSPAAAQNNNTAYGEDALLGNTGSANSAFGKQALGSSNSGDTNSAVGAFALELNSSGSYNTGVGFYALQNNRSGSDNTATGRSALS